MDLELYMERVEQYTRNTMPEAERRFFEAELAVNPDLQEALDLYLLGQEVIEQGVEAQLRLQLQGWSKSASETTTAAPTMTASRVNTRPMWIRLAAAASVALIIGWFSVQWAGSNYSDEAIFAGQYKAPDPSTFRSGTAMENPLEPGFRALEDGNLRAAEDFFKNISPEQERYAEAQFYLGNTAVQLEHYDLAIDAFNACIQRNETRYRERAEWNLLLTYVAAEQTDDPNFRNLLNSVIETEHHSYRREATKLKKDLESFWRKISL